MKRVAMGFFVLGAMTVLAACETAAPTSNTLIPYEPTIDRKDPEQGARLKRYYPGDPRSYFVAAYDAAYVCDHAASEADIRHALKIGLRLSPFKEDPARLAQWRAFLVGTLFIQRKYAQAVEQEKILIKNAPGDVQYIFGHAKTLFVMKRYDAVRATADQLIQLEPDTFRGYLMRGSANYREGKFTAAIADFTEATETSPDSPMLMMQLGMAQAADGHYTIAIAVYAAALLIERQERKSSGSVDMDMENLILEKLGHAEAALKATDALGPGDHAAETARIRADLFAADVPPDAPSNSLGCKG